MKLKTLLTTLLTVSYACAVAQMPADTLLQASSARCLNLNYSPDALSLDVKQINGTKDTFHYKFSTSATAASDDEPPLLLVDQTVTMRYSDVINILVVTSDSTLTVSFTDNIGTPVRNTYPLAASPNRSIRTWTGNGEFGIGIPISHSGKTKWNVITSGLALGFVTPTSASQPMQPLMGRSLEWTWNIIVGVEANRGRSTFQTGLGMRLRKVNTGAMHYFDKGEDGRISMLPYNEGAHDAKSGIHMFSLQIPVFYRLRFAGNWGATIGPIVNFNTGAHLSTRYKIGDRKYEINTHDIGQRPVTVDGLLAITFDGLGLYARYSPMNVLRDRAGLDFGTFSTGLIVAF